MHRRQFASGGRGLAFAFALSVAVAVARSRPRVLGGALGDGFGDRRLRLRGRRRCFGRRGGRGGLGAALGACEVAVVAAGRTSATSVGASAPLCATGLIAEPMSTPKASSAITATAAARGVGIGRASAPASPASSAAAADAEAPSASISSAMKERKRSPSRAALHAVALIGCHTRAAHLAASGRRRRGALRGSRESGHPGSVTYRQEARSGDNDLFTSRAREEWILPVNASAWRFLGRLRPFTRGSQRDRHRIQHPHRRVAVRVPPTGLPPSRAGHLTAARRARALRDVRRHARRRSALLRGVRAALRPLAPPLHPHRCSRAERAGQGELRAALAKAARLGQRDADRRRRHAAAGARNRAF